MITLLTTVTCLGTLLALAVQLYRCVLKRSWHAKLSLPELTAYIGKESHRVGDVVQVCVHSTQKARATLLRLGKTLEEVERSQEIEPHEQSPVYDRWQGLRWQPNLEIETTDLLPGAYCLVFRTVDDPDVTYRVPLLLRSAKSRAVAVVASTNTWQAYNDFAGLSNYADHVSPWPLSWAKRLMALLNIQFQIGDRHHFPSVPLPTNRPNDAIDLDLRELQSCPIENFSHLLRAEWSLLRFLEEKDIEYNLYSDRDLAQAPEITDADILIFNTHSEYWSEEMIGRLQAYLFSGGQALFVSGNNQYRKVDLLEDSLVVYDFKTDAKETSELLGSAYDARGYQTYGGFRIAAAEHWLFDSLDVATGDLFAHAVGHTGRPLGASGYETDKLTAHSGAVTVLAIGDNREGPAYMVYKQVGDGAVLNTGSVASAPWVEKDPVLGGLVTRFINNAVSQAELKQERDAA